MPMIYANDTAERQLIGAILIGCHGIDFDSTSEDLFQNPENREIYSTLRRLHDEGRDPKETSELVEAFGFDKAQDLIKLMNDAPQYGRQLIILKILQECKRKAALQGALENTLNTLKESGADAALDELTRIVEDPENAGHAEAISEPVKDILPEAINYLGNLSNTGIRTGFDTLDAVIGGFQAGWLTIVGARPSDGKSALLQDFALNIAKTGKKVLFFSMEDSKNEVVSRWICKEGRIERDEMENDSPAGGHKLEHVIEVLSNGNIMLSDEQNLTPKMVRKEIKRLTRIDQAPDILFIDYIQLMHGDSTVRADQRRYELEEISRELKKTAVKYKIPIVVAAQLNRNSEKENRDPILADLRESGALEQDANVVIMIGDKDCGPNVRKLIIAKNRNGQQIPNGIRVKWLPAYAKFEN